MLEKYGTCPDSKNRIRHTVTYWIGIVVLFCNFIWTPIVSFFFFFSFSILFEFKEGNDTTGCSDFLTKKKNLHICLTLRVTNLQIKLKLKKIECWITERFKLQQQRQRFLYCNELSPFKRVCCFTFRHHFESHFNVWCEVWLALVKRVWLIKQLSLIRRREKKRTQRYSFFSVNLFDA